MLLRHLSQRSTGVDLVHSVPLSTKLQPPSLTLKQIYNLCEAQICELTSFKLQDVCVAFNLFRLDPQLLLPTRVPVYVTECLTFKKNPNTIWVFPPQKYCCNKYFIYEASVVLLVALRCSAMLCFHGVK